MGGQGEKTGGEGGSNEEGSCEERKRERRKRGIIILPFCLDRKLGKSGDLFSLTSL